MVYSKRLDRKRWRVEFVKNVRYFSLFTTCLFHSTLVRAKGHYSVLYIYCQKKVSERCSRPRWVCCTRVGLHAIEFTFHRVRSFMYIVPERNGFNFDWFLQNVFGYVFFSIFFFILTLDRAKCINIFIHWLSKTLLNW